MNRLPELSIDLVDVAKRNDGILSTLKVEEIKQIEARYKKFLYLAKIYPNATLSPTFDIDQMWHLHMLHPRNYYSDCMSIFGDIMDHDAGFGKKEEELPILLNYVDETEELWKKEFHEEYITNLTKELKKKNDNSSIQGITYDKHYMTCTKKPEGITHDKHYMTCTKKPEGITHDKHYMTCTKKKKAL